MATHQFNVEIAAEYGILESIILCNLHYWIEKNKANDTNFYDGRTWTFNSTKAFSKLFPYASEGQIRRALKKLETENLIVTGNYNKSAYDRTMWYALTDYSESIFEKSSLHLSDSQNGKSENETPIPNNKHTDNKQTSVNTDNKDITGSPEPVTALELSEPVKPEKKKKAEKVERHKYGEYNNVLLSDEEIEKLQTEFPDLQQRIERLSEYMASTGKSYKSHYATIKAWARKDSNTPQSYQPPQKQTAYEAAQAELQRIYEMTKEEEENDGKRNDADIFADHDCLPGF